MRRPLCVLGFLVLVVGPAFAGRASLTPSRAAFLRQVDAARRQALPHARTASDLDAMVANGDLVRVAGNGDFEVKAGTPYPFARPELQLFLERIAVGYRRVCGERLVVTSLARPRNRQPRNASPESVHPAGIAVDVRRSWDRGCRGWFEARLLDLEEAGVLEAASERNPPHYHIVVFPDPYLRHTGLTLGQAMAAGGGSSAADPAVVTTTYRYVVQPGDSLWAIAGRYGTSATDILRANGLRSSVLRPGQVLEVPTGGGPGPTAVARATTYRVQPGDNLWRIARRHGTSPRLLQSENGLPSTRIYPGQLLRIPVGGS